MLDSGSVINRTAGTIDGDSTFGIVITCGGTVTNQSGGTISGSQGAVMFHAGYTNRLVIDPGAVFGGGVDGGNAVGSTTTSTLELAAGASTGTVSGLGSQYVDFTTLQFDSGANWLVNANPAGQLGQIAGFAAGDTIALTGFTATSSTFLDGSLTLTGTGVTNATTLEFVGLPDLSSFQITAAADGTDVALEPICFRAGTRIATPDGERAVEHLVPGDHVLTVSGAAQKIVWIGQRRIDLDRHRRPRQAAPIRIRRGAFRPDLPRRDLFLSPNHAVFVDEVLIPVRYLVNGTTILREPPRGTVHYLHIELAHHDVLLAEGLAAETYLEVGDRCMFDNAGTLLRLHPHLSALHWEAAGYAPLVVTGPVLQAIRDRLAKRAGSARRPGSQAAFNVAA
jgi:collagen type I/II/III/V/XI/XXIV/XXVII alpha